LHWHFLQRDGISIQRSPDGGLREWFANDSKVQRWDVDHIRE